MNKNFKITALANALDDRELFKESDCVMRIAQKLLQDLGMAQPSPLPSDDPAFNTPGKTPQMPGDPSQSISDLKEAGIDPGQYSGTSSQNEALRSVLSNRLGKNFPTFYDAYVETFGHWDDQPSQRIQNLSGASTGAQSSQLPMGPQMQSQQAPNPQEKESMDFMNSLLNKG